MREPLNEILGLHGGRPTGPAGLKVSCGLPRIEKGHELGAHMFRPQQGRRQFQRLRVL